MKLVKLNPDHYIIVSEEKLRKGDWFLSKENIVHRNYGYNYGDRKITHSTQVSVLNEEEQKAITKIDLSKVKSLFAEDDVETKGFNWYVTANKRDTIFDLGWINIFKGGYNQCLADNAEKKYTEADMRAACRMATTPRHDGTVLFFSEEEVMESFQTRSEWEVEFDENGELKLL